MKKKLILMMFFVFVFAFSLAPAALTTYTVLWDTSHGVLSGPFGDYQPDGYYSQLSDDLMDNDFSVYTTMSGFNSTNLVGIDVAVVSVLSSFSSAYEATEIEALNTFVSGGGGLLIMGEHIGAPVENINPLASEFGFEFGPTDINTGGISITDISEHQIFNEVNQISLHESSEITLSGSAVSVGYADNGKTAIAIAEHGLGRVVAISDSTLWASDGTFVAYYDLPDNPQFALNTFEYLAVPEPATLIILGIGGLFIATKKRRW